MTSPVWNPLQTDGGIADGECSNSGVLQNPLKLPGIDVTARVKFTDGRGNAIYTKDYTGSGRMTPGVEVEAVNAVILRAVTAIVRNILTDDSLDKAINTVLNAGTR